MIQAPLMPQKQILSLVAPVDGVVVPLEDLPDPVFAEKMLGDGLSIDPTTTRIFAPCSGVITQFHRAKHALTIRTAQGMSVLVHVGLDTVKLKGDGFTALVNEGDTVTVNQPLLDFDMDRIAQGAMSALVEIVVTEGGEFFSFKKDGGTVVCGDEILRVSSAPAPHSGTQEKISARSAGEATTDAGGRHVSHATIVNPHGMHARPAARLVKEAKSFRAEVLLTASAGTVSAVSVADIMSLDLGHGDDVEISATGPDAASAIEAVRQAITEGLGEKLDSTSNVGEKERWVSTEEGVLGGVPASPGLSIGTAKVRLLQLPPFEEKGRGGAVEKAALAAGLAATRAELGAEEKAFKQKGETEKAQIFGAHQELLEDKGIVADAERAILDGASAAYAFHTAMQRRIEKLGALKSPLLRQRAADMTDVAHRALYAISKTPRPQLDLGDNTVLICDDLTPSTVASLPADKIAAIVTRVGGATSHAAIIARSMGVPYVAALGDAYEKIRDGQTLIVNGLTGAVTLDPNEAALAAARREIARLRVAGESQQSHAHEPAVTKDGRRIEVAANIGSLKDAQAGSDNGCDAVGLLRSEFLFLGRRDAPTEEEQKDEYVAIAKVLGPERSLVIRTLDVGGDKPLPYIPLADEENPFLGIRGLRVSFKYPDLFRSQLRAALAAAEFTKLNLMFPMVAGRDEFLRARDITREEMLAMGATQNVSVGVMVEVPSAALNAHWLAKEVDFFSIGTNDLTQYTLAMDRGHAELSGQADAFDPAVLRLIRMTAEAAHAEGRWVGICGGLAAEPLASALLVGLDIDELSVPAPVIPELKERIRGLDTSDCRALAEGALAQPSAATVRALLASFMGK